MPLTFLRNLGIVSAAGITTTKLGAGAIIQVSSIATTTVGQVLATSLSLSITPSSASNKILLISNINCGLGDDEGFGVRFLRDATNVFTTTQTYASYAQGITDLYATLPVVYIDSPSTTSAITYKVQGAAYSNKSITFQIGMQSIFYAMEIAG
jgi:hypothetical protein